MVCVVRFPVIGRYQVGAKMRYIIDDPEHDALESCPFEAFPIYLNLRKRMDFATGVVGGPKRRISWGEIAEWLHRDASRGRKAVHVSISKARRIVDHMVRAGLVEFQTDRENDRLMFRLPLAYSDATEAERRKDPVYLQELQQAVAETPNCVPLERYRKREATTGCYLPDDETEAATGQPQAFVESPANCAETRQGFDSPADMKANSLVEPESSDNSVAYHQETAETRQGFDSPADAKADNNNPFTPIGGNNNNIHTPTSACAREDFVSLPRVSKAVRDALGMAPKVESALPITTSPTDDHAPPGERQRSVKDDLLPDLETLGYDEESGFSCQISAGFRKKHPETVVEIQRIIAMHFGGDHER